MKNFIKKMAVNGFESNDNYEHTVRCLKSFQTTQLKCLNIEGDAERHKTAFANALAKSLDITQILYHDFTQQKEPIPKVVLPEIKDDRGQKEYPIDAFDRIVIEACAYSEEKSTVLIVDQLQAADFREHIRLHGFIKSTQWEGNNSTYTANQNHLMIFLISEKKLFHSLQKSSFRVWVNATSDTYIHYTPKDFDLSDDAIPILKSLAKVFSSLNIIPTYSEYKNIINDIHFNIRNEQDLRQSIYGWTEGIDRELLYHDEIKYVFKEAVTVIENYMVDEEVEMVEIKE